MRKQPWSCAHLSLNMRESREPARCHSLLPIFTQRYYAHPLAA
jgi:hypothetical protein